MGLVLDAEIEAAAVAALAIAGRPPQTARGDAVGLRTVIDQLFVAMNLHAPKVAGIERRSFQAMASDGTPIELTWYAREGSRPGAAALYLHGGGMICGSVEAYDPIISDYVAATGVPMLAVEYRLAPEFPHPYPAEDCFAGLAWIFEHARELQVDPERIAVMGDSGGGGLAAAVALMARDRGLALKRQILIYPMLDDRNLTPDPELVPFAGWTYDNNYTGWQALLGEALGSSRVSPYAAPARVTDLRGVAKAYIEVGELDIFRDEDIEYARRIASAGVSVELHVHPGCPHGFERGAPDSDVATRAMADRHRALRAL